MWVSLQVQAVIYRPVSQAVPWSPKREYQNEDLMTRSVFTNETSVPRPIR